MRRIRRLFRKSRAEKELDQELHFHLERQISDYITAGVTPDEAGRRAQQEFGGLERVKEEVRDTRWETHLDNVIRDFRYALRTLRKDRRFSLIAILALALGIGASTIVFSVVYNLFFHALPYKDYNRSVVLSLQKLGGADVGKVRRYFSPAEVRAFREQNHVFEEIIAYIGFRPKYDDGKSVRFFSFGAQVTANTFDCFGVSPLLGRTISQEDGKPGAPPVFVMNYRLWQREFGGDPKILGTTFIFNGKPTTLVGIIPCTSMLFARISGCLSVQTRQEVLSWANSNQALTCRLAEQTSMPSRTACISRIPTGFFQRTSSSLCRRRC